MIRFFYTIFIFFYKNAITLASIFNKKAKYKIQGIRDSKTIIDNYTSNNRDVPVLIHCSSQGEHEQALPIIRWIIGHTTYNIVLSFYSPSGYRNANYQEQSRIVKIYLPFDTPYEMSYLVTSIRPKYAIIIKNEWWWNLLHELRAQNVKTFLASATIRKSHYFIKYPISFFRNGLKAFTTIFVVDEASKMILSKVYNGKIRLAKDTRIDQVNFIKSQLSKDFFINSKQDLGPTIVYGSIWQSDIESINRLLEIHPNATHLIFPHELGTDNIQSLKNKIPKSNLIKNLKDISSGIQIITSMGELKYAYKLASMAYIGGGFGTGIHNILEAAVYFIPTLFGPNYHKSNEARHLVLNNCCYTIEKTSELEGICKIINKETIRKEIETKLKSYFSPEYSPSEIICQEIFMKK